jgi:hypothetical protein
VHIIVPALVIKNPEGERSPKQMDGSALYDAIMEAEDVNPFFSRESITKGYQLLDFLMNKSAEDFKLIEYKSGPAFTDFEDKSVYPHH